MPLMPKTLLLVCICKFLISSAAYAQEEPPGLPLKYLRHASQHFGFSAGGWLPLGDLEVLGNHPSLGFQWGFRHYQMEFNINLDLRFLKSRNEYAVLRDNQLYYDNSYTGGFIGLDYVYYFAGDARTEIGLLAGIGYDGFDLNRDRIPAKPSEISSLNMNAGLRINLYTRGETYFGLQPRFNLIRYHNKGGTSFSGNAISVDLFVSGWWR